MGSERHPRKPVQNTHRLGLHARYPCPRSVLKFDFFRISRNSIFEFLSVHSPDYIRYRLVLCDDHAVCSTQKTKKSLQNATNPNFHRSESGSVPFNQRKFLYTGQSLRLISLKIKKVRSSNRKSATFIIRKSRPVNGLSNYDISVFNMAVWRPPM